MKENNFKFTKSQQRKRKKLVSENEKKEQRKKLKYEYRRKRQDSKKKSMNTIKNCRSRTDKKRALKIVFKITK